MDRSFLSDLNENNKDFIPQEEEKNSIKNPNIHFL